ncbi:hypothetical protein SLA2020_238410 [Shorea laevis]
MVNSAETPGYLPAEQPSGSSPADQSSDSSPPDNSPPFPDNNGGSSDSSPESSPSPSTPPPTASPKASPPENVSPPPTPPSPPKNSPPPQATPSPPSPPSPNNSTANTTPFPPPTPSHPPPPPRASNPPPPPPPLPANRTFASPPSKSSNQSSSHVPSSPHSPSSSKGEPSVSTQTLQKVEGKSSFYGIVAGATVAGVLIIAFLAIFFLLVRRRKEKSQKNENSNHYTPPPPNFAVKSDGYYYGDQSAMGPNSGYSPKRQNSNSGNSCGYYGGTPDSGIISGKIFFIYEELMEITNGFSRQNVLGEGGFGCVYKGCLPDGRVVAVKQLKAGSGQGEREFRAEVEIISRVHHRHLVSLVGYCICEHQRLLIYEFVPNQTLEHHLHGKGVPVLEWTKRMKIAIGSAKGLAYLHEDCHPKIIHRDIKSANILLDDAFEAQAIQVADFGLARLNDTPHTHVSTRVMGTFGYLAPEYASSGKLTDRSDVFSFGVVLLELLTGRKPVDSTQPLGDESLVEWARPHLIHALESGDFGELIDPRLEKHYVEREVFRMIEAAAACVRHSAAKRPRMVQVIRALDFDGEMSDLSNGVKYGQSTVYNSGQYNQDIMKFRRMELGNQISSDFDMYSGEYSNTSREHGKSQSSSREFSSSDSESRARHGPS